VKLDELGADLDLDVIQRFDAVDPPTRIISWSVQSLASTGEAQ
jgi:hypothetical protein